MRRRGTGFCEDGKCVTAAAGCSLASFEVDTSTCPIEADLPCILRCRNASGYCFSSYQLPAVLDETMRFMPDGTRCTPYSDSAVGGTCEQGFALFGTEKLRRANRFGSRLRRFGAPPWANSYILITLIT